MKRRTLLHGAIPAAVAIGAAGCSVRVPAYRLFNESEGAILSALADQIVPADDTPGASGAQVLRFLDRQLARAYSAFRSAYREGLASLDRCALQTHGQGFAALAFTEQEALVERMEQGDLPREIWGSLPPREFFGMVRSHVMQGYYGDPRHGGNRDRVSWRMLAIPYPPIRGRDDYRFPKPQAAPVAEQGGGG